MLPGNDNNATTRMIQREKMTLSRPGKHVVFVFFVVFVSLSTFPSPVVVLTLDFFLVCLGLCWNDESTLQ
jgi:hypothetical protein